LPEGASKIYVKPNLMAEFEKDVTYSFLDFTGKPTLIFNEQMAFH